MKQDLDRACRLAAEDKEVPAERVGPEHLLHLQREAEHGDDAAQGIRINASSDADQTTIGRRGLDAAPAELASGEAR